MTPGRCFMDRRLPVVVFSVENRLSKRDFPPRFTHVLFVFYASCCICSRYFLFGRSLNSQNGLASSCPTRACHHQVVEVSALSSAQQGVCVNKGFVSDRILAILIIKAIAFPCGNNLK
jgi:hypothetical protein